MHIWKHSKLREDANWYKQNWCYCQSKTFSGKSDTVRYLKIFRIISNEASFLVLILCRWYFSCLQMHSEKCFNIYFTDFNPYVPNAPILYPLETSENLTVFWCLERVEKRCTGNEWVKTVIQIFVSKEYTSGFFWKIIALTWA